MKERLSQGTIVEITDAESSFFGKRGVVLEHDRDGVYVAFTESHYLESLDTWSNMINVPPHDMMHLRAVPDSEYRVLGTS